MTVEILLKMFRVVDIDSDKQVTAWMAMLYAFHMLLRKSNLVPDMQSKFDPDKQLARKNLCLADNTVLVDIVWSKNM